MLNGLDPVPDSSGDNQLENDGKRHVKHQELAEQGSQVTVPYRPGKGSGYCSFKWYRWQYSTLRPSRAWRCCMHLSQPDIKVQLIPVPRFSLSILVPHRRSSIGTARAKPALTLLGLGAVDEKGLRDRGASVCVCAGGERGAGRGGVSVVCIA